MNKLWAPSNGNRFSANARKIIHEVSRLVFGNLPVVNRRTGFKVLSQKPIGPLATSHYTINSTRSFTKVLPGFTTDLEERRLERLERFKREGKSPPKKGQGKRATKKK